VPAPERSRNVDIGLNKRPKKRKKTRLKEIEEEKVIN
jgi:hypothetical protein